MAICARWDSRSKYLDVVDELIIPFHGKVDNLTDFLERHKHQRIIIDVRDDWKNFYGTILTPVYEKYANLVLRLTDRGQVLNTSIKNAGIPYFINEVCVEWEKLNEIIDLGVTDVYISEQLCFELADVSRLAAAAGVRVRVYPNIAQSARESTNPLKKFFVRPEDVDIYNRRYVSTFEFYYPEGVDINWDVLYRAYAVNKKWRGPLKEIIIGLEDDIDSTYVSPRWAELRMNCKRKCLKGGNCSACIQISALSKAFEELAVMPVLPKDTKAAAKEVLAAIDAKDVTKEEPVPPPIIPNF